MRNKAFLLQDAKRSKTSPHANQVDGLHFRGSPGADSDDTTASTTALEKPGAFAGDGAAEEEAIHLERRVGLFSGVALIVGTMIGSGIFVSPAGLLERTGSVGLSLVVWAACGLLSMLGAMAYAELGTLVPYCGGEYSYYMEAFGGLPAYMYSWVSVIVLKPSMLGIICLSFAQYIVNGFIPLHCAGVDQLVKVVGIMTIGALSYAELGLVVPESGGEGTYLLAAFGHLHNFLGPLFGYLFNYLALVAMKPAQVAIICLTFSKYVLDPVFNALKWQDCDFEDRKILLEKLVAAACICIITWVNCHSVKLATQVQNGFMCAKLLAIAVIVGTGCVKIAQGETQYLRTGFENSKTSYGTLAIAFYQGLWAYDGWNNLNYVTEEIKNPNRNLPLSIIIAIPLVTICYVLVNISYLTVMSPSELLQAEAVAVTFGNKVLGVFAWFMPLSVALSTFGAANGTEFTSGRLCYAAAREGHLVQVLSFVNLRRYTPMPALIFNAVVALIMIIPGDIDSLIEFFSFTAWIFYGGAMAALLVLRRTRASVVRPYKVNLIIPITVLLASIFLVVAPLVEDPKLEYLYATMFIFTGLIFYVPFVYYKIQWGPMEKITRFFQLIMEVVPTDHMPDI